MENEQIIARFLALRPTGSGYGSGYGSGSGIKKIENRMVQVIDGVFTILTNVKGNVASGYILNDDLTEERCYVVKGHGYFAHGRTLKEARDALVSKHMENLDEEALFEKFFASFKNDKKYNGHRFFEWHHYLTGSCLMGRETFVKNRGLDLDSYFTVKDFFELTRNDYGSNVIRDLEERWNGKYGL